jgi:quinoprotein glucose dehydrogenase
MLLADLALNPTLSEMERQMALRTLALIPSGVVADFTMGEYRPVLARPSAPLAAGLRPKINQIFTQAPSSVIAAALPVARAFAIPVSEGCLFAWAEDKSQCTPLRLAATASLSADRVVPLLTVADVEVRSAAAKRRVALQPATIEATVRTLWQQGADHDLRTAYELLAKSDQPIVVNLLLAESDRWLANQLPTQVKLDLYEAVAARSETVLKEKLTAIDAKLIADKQTPFDLALIGGDAINGHEVFINQGTCLKCHRLDGEGGSAGPKLDQVAERLSPDKLLESLVNPNAEISKGYGITSVVMKDGNVYAGSIAEEDEKSLKLKTPIGEVKTIDREKIAQTTPPMSPMPALGHTLSKRNLRDLIAYLQSLK